MNRQELKLQARAEIAAVVESMDLADLLGDELAAAQYLPGGKWIYEALAECQRQAVSLLEKM